MQGVNVTAFAYGPKGTGKSYTLLGAGGGTELVSMAKGEESEGGIGEGHHHRGEFDALERELEQSASSFSQGGSNSNLQKNPEARV